MRLRRALWYPAVIAVWIGGLVGAVALDQNDWTWYFAGGVPLTIVAGALLDRWWASLVPWVLTVILFAVAFVSNPGCSDCGEDSYGLQLVYMMILFTVPATVAMALGVAARRLTRFFRNPQSG
jgi:hypothetical protein